MKPPPVRLWINILDDPHNQSEDETHTTMNSPVRKEFVHLVSNYILSKEYFLQGLNVHIEAI
jgi:hypothetical protein